MREINEGWDHKGGGRGVAEGKRKGKEKKRER